MGYIYKITNIVNNMIYIGQTSEEIPERRFQGHIQAIRCGKGCTALGNAMRKYGEDKFKFQVIIICFDEDRFAYEKEYIKKYNSLVPNGYNIQEGGPGGCGFKGRKHSEETISKIKAHHIEYFANKEKRDKLIGYSKKYWANSEMRKLQSERLKTSENHKKAVINRQKNTVTQDITNKKTSDSLKEYYKSEENKEKLRIAFAKAKGKPVLQYDSNNNFIKRYISIQDASRGLEVTQRAIQVALKGGTKTCKGFLLKLEPTA